MQLNNQRFRRAAGAAAACLAAAALVLFAGRHPERSYAAPEYGYEIVNVYPHDDNAFTQGLFFEDGVLYESTGLVKASSIRKVALETGTVLQKRDLPPPHFGEGMIRWNGKILQLTWKGGIGFIYDALTFEPLGEFKYEGEGWGFTKDDKRLIMSDGTSALRFVDPVSLKETKRIKVTDGDRPVEQLNELEWVNGKIFANVWKTQRIAVIDPQSGKVTAWLRLDGLWNGADDSKTLNGIAYDAVRDRIFVTGKKWPKLFEIRIVKN